MNITFNLPEITRIPKSCRECPATYEDTGDDAYWGRNERRCVFSRDVIPNEGVEYDCPIVRTHEEEK